MATTTLSDSPSAMRYRWGRHIGPWGTTARAVLGAGSLTWALAVPHDHPAGNIPGSHMLWWNILLGLGIIPAVATVTLRLRGRGAAPLRIGSGGALCGTVALVAVAQVIPVAILLFIGATMLIQAGRGADGCELLEIPNMLLRRHDRLFCLPLTPIDVFEARRLQARVTQGRPGVAAQRFIHGRGDRPSS
jgi:hypothetical protein